jgi:hypothetical protein
MQALGVTGDHWIAGTSHSVDSLIHMYEQLGDALSHQYGQYPLFRFYFTTKLGSKLEFPCFELLNQSRFNFIYFLPILKKCKDKIRIYLFIHLFIPAP